MKITDAAPAQNLLFSGKVDRSKAKTVFGGYSSSRSLALPKDLLPNFFFRRLISTSEGGREERKKVRYDLSLHRRERESSNDKCEGLEGEALKSGLEDGWHDA